jgi:LytS/YehU family sensor histidine kinase
MVENAIKHGLYNKPDGNWKLAVYVLQLKDKLVISVEDNGLGLEKANENKTHSTGSGLSMLKKQLKILSNHSKKYTYRLSDIYDAKGQVRGARASIFITSY